MFRLRLRARARRTGKVTMARLAVLAIVVATASTATVQRSYVNDGTAPVMDTFTATALTAPGGTAATHPGGTAATAGTADTGLTFTVVPVRRPSLTIAKTHAGTFVQGQDGVYTITVGDATTAAAPTNGTTVTVHDVLPAGLRADRITGRGWRCTPATLTCTRGDVLPAGHHYPPVTLKVGISCNARARVTNTATVTGGGDPATRTATDTTTIRHHGHDRDGRHDGCDRHDH
ncbi:DUF11 domain-containing protein [Actinacidiphila rubida]|uniref:DUF11 domain-containing protein n=1 Tax=Actinacidiphila rubida TaxID=310780 RepID=A0A1H8R9T1_9ACTN|nr:DUF11 domain-containing protein [Actinacidiphila rubida]SEO63116.1 hypothetical protein SAMN05216267_103372 [Actinacidiphila rubida]SEP00574.1 hypothetical protein SAMN05216267_106828 [Actinacidiphila rubida]